MQKSLDQKLAALHADPSGCREFILADAKDADMAFGMPATGVVRENSVVAGLPTEPHRWTGGLPDSQETSGRSIGGVGRPAPNEGGVGRPAPNEGGVGRPAPNEERERFRSLEEYREQIRAVVRQGIVDIMLMSASTCEQLVLRERLFDGSHITPAVRANDTTDIHVMRGSRLALEGSQPFRTLTLDHAQCGHIDCEAAERRLGVDLGLYSVTFNNDRQLDLVTLEAYKAFREEAERKSFRHFLEVFNPNLPDAVAPEQMPQFINDVIARTLAGVTSKGRPLFLKTVYNGPAAMEELVAYDPHLIVGVLGGASGTTLDAFLLLAEAQKYGARAALFGRKINNAENQLAFIEFLRLIADGVIEPVEAVRAYHAVLGKLGIRPHRALEDDLTVQTNVMSYGGSGRTVSVPVSANPQAPPGAGEEHRSSPADGQTPNFAKMTSDERLAYHRARLNRTFGE